MSLLKFKKKKKEENNVIVQENPDECVRIVETMFLKGVFNDKVTDVSYNGTDFYAQDNDIGRYKLALKISSDEVLSFIKKIANYMLHPFSNINPSLDVSFGNYRLNALHPSLARNNNKKVVTFSLRRITATLKIREDDPNLCPLEIHNLLKVLIRSRQSVLISGTTGSGKTEFQKFLVSLMDKKDRLIVIEESYETHLKEIFPEMDITSWIVNNSRDELAKLIRVSLRNNPDWIIVAETRGAEAFDMLNAVMTGHSAITTIHTESAKFSVDRISAMCKKNVEFDEKMLQTNVARHLKIGIHMERIYNVDRQKYIRRIREIVEYVPKNEGGYEINQIYEITVDDKGREKHVFGVVSNDLYESFLRSGIDLKNIQRFIKKVEKKPQNAKRKKAKV